MTPALLTQVSILPNSSTLRRASARTASSSATSVGMASARLSARGPALLRGLPQAVFAPGGQHHPCAVLGEEPRRRASYAARGAGHDDHGALDLPRHPTRPPHWFRGDRRYRAPP